jgi:hypothetical protein
MKRWIREKLADEQILVSKKVIALTPKEVHAVAVGLAVLRGNIMQRDGNLKACPEIDEVGRKLQSDWYDRIVLRKKS